MSGEQSSSRPPGRRAGAVPRIGKAPGPDHPLRGRDETDAPPVEPPAAAPAPAPSRRRDEDPLVPFGSRLRRSTHRRLRIYATIHEQDIQDITDQAVVEWLDRQEQG